jgi:hypothetical protein
MAMATATTTGNGNGDDVAGDKEDNGQEGSKGNSNDHEDGRQH